MSPTHIVSGCRQLTHTSNRPSKKARQTGRRDEGARRDESKRRSRRTSATEAQWPLTTTRSQLPQRRSRASCRRQLEARASLTGRRTNTKSNGNPMTRPRPRRELEEPEGRYARPRRQEAHRGRNLARACYMQTRDEQGRLQAKSTKMDNPVESTGCSGLVRPDRAGQSGRVRGGHVDYERVCWATASGGWASGESC